LTNAINYDIITNVRQIHNEVDDIMTNLNTIELTDAEKKFVNYMKENHSGKAKAIKAKDLKARFGSTRKIRLMTHGLRLEGIPVCTGQTGYYFASSTDEVKESIRYIDSYIDDLNKVRSGLNKSITGYFNK
jgi:hypothetical protein